jgi:RluA family pseudouridine synthase
MSEGPRVDYRCSKASTLLEALKFITGWSEGDCEALVRKGFVFLNSRKVRAPHLEKTLRVGDEISLWKVEAVRTSKNQETFQMSQDWICYEDSDLVVLNKPSGLPTQKTLDPRRPYLYLLAQEYFRARGKTYLGLHHRLDRDTSGLILMTLSERANKGVAELFQNHRIEKEYWAVVERIPRTFQDRRDSFEVKNYLKKSSQRGRMEVAHSGGDLALTRFRWVDRNAEGYGIIRAWPQTGRKHQIRVHLAGLGFPIVGDATYGRAGDTRMMLHARFLTFLHPILNVRVSVEAPLPPEMLKCLNAHHLSFAIPGGDDS